MLNIFPAIERRILSQNGATLTPSAVFDISFRIATRIALRQDRKPSSSTTRTRPAQVCGGHTPACRSPQTPGAAGNLAAAQRTTPSARRNVPSKRRENWSKRVKAFTISDAVLNSEEQFPHIGPLGSKRRVGPGQAARVSPWLSGPSDRVLQAPQSAGNRQQPAPLPLPAKRRSMVKRCTKRAAQTPVSGTAHMQAARRARPACAVNSVNSDEAGPCLQQRGRARKQRMSDTEVSRDDPVQTHEPRPHATDLIGPEVHIQSRETIWTDEDPQNVPASDVSIRFSRPCAFRPSCAAHATKTPRRDDTTSLDDANDPAPVQIIAPAQSAYPLERTKPSELTQPVERAEPLVPSEPLQPLQPLQLPELLQLPQPLQLPESCQPKRLMDDAKLLQASGCAASAQVSSRSQQHERGDKPTPGHASLLWTLSGISGFLSWWISSSSRGFRSAWARTGISLMTGGRR